MQLLRAIQRPALSHRWPQLRFAVVRRGTATTSKPEKTLIYSTPNASVVRILKAFSVGALGVPIALQAAGISEYMFLSESIFRYVVSLHMIAALAASSCSTACVQYFLSPYIINLYLHTETPRAHSLPPITPNTTITLETLNLFARPTLTTLQLKDLRLPGRELFLTWRVKRNVLEEGKGRIRQSRFWLDDQNGIGDREAVRKIVDVVRKNNGRKILGGF
ncbi:hypothetical protein BC937DRAFT_86192 [Endogone sp. FLAS-F59071]|nr:hypothetical protein BC937DRAFT_86192 [Endogone sp. FLAS-F59071]|eukprot:RUS13185.1 hypothetical protein BC937DRAFT_86192 [Endogone sp. FLAS-F59071]